MKISEAVQHPLVRRAAIALYILCIVGVISAYIGISTVETRSALYFQGDSTLQAGAPNVVRGAFIDARIGQFVHPSDFRFSLVNADESPANEIVVGQGKSGAGGFAHIELNIPKSLPPGTYDLVLEAQNTELGIYEARQSIEIISARTEPEQWPTKTERADPQQLAAKQAEAKTKRSSQTPEDAETEDGILIDVLPGDHEIVRGLPNTIYLRTRDAKTQQPVSARLLFKSTKGLLDGKQPTELKTDRLGLASFALTPITDQNWQIEAETADGTRSEAEVILISVASQFKVQVKNPVFISGKPIDGAVYSLFETGAFFIDLYAQNRRVAASALGLQPGGSGLYLETPSEKTNEDPQSAAIYRLHVYGDFYHPANAWDSAYIARVDDSSVESLRKTALQTLRFIAANTDLTDAYYSEILANNVLETATHSELARWLPALLLAIPRQFELSPELFNTQHADRAELEIWKASVKSDLKLLVAVVLLIGIVALFYFTLLGIQQVRARSQRIYASESELDHDGFDGGERADSNTAARDFSRMNELAVAVQGGMLLLSIILFALGIWMLLGYL